MDCAYFRYSVDDGCTDGEFDHAYSITSVFEEGEDVAEEAAEDYHKHHDGWEADWSAGITFTIWKESGELLGHYTVHLDFHPTFRATPAPALRLEEG